MATDLVTKLNSKFIVLDGGDGCGKSTQQGLIADRLRRQGLTVTCVRDPGTTSAGEAIREIILSGRHGRLCPESELLLFMAARAQMMDEIIAPALAAGQVVLADRFVSASCAYQGASGLDLASIIAMGAFAVRSRWPDLTIVLDVPVHVGMKRIGGHGDDLDAMEARPTGFHEKVRQIFRNLPDTYPAKVTMIDATGLVNEVSDQIMEVLARVDV